MILYILLIVLAFILHSPWPVVAGIVLYLLANWDWETPSARRQRKTRKAAQRARKSRGVK